MQNLKTQALQTTKIVLLALILAAGLQYVSAATSWAPAAGAPPGNNTYAPINVGAAGQTKLGGITVGMGNPSVGLEVRGGSIRFTSLGSPAAGNVLESDGSGNLRWGTDDVGSGGSSSGIGCVGCGGNDNRLTKVYQNGSAVTPSNIYSTGSGNSGSVGINTANPTATLDVDGTIRLRGGNPGPGKVLVSSGDGTASWGAAGGSTPSNCSWVTPVNQSAEQQLLCPAGKIVAGLGLRDTATQGGVALRVTQMYCCSLGQ